MTLKQYLAMADFKCNSIDPHKPMDMMDWSNVKAWMTECMEARKQIPTLLEIIRELTAGRADAVQVAEQIINAKEAAQ